MQVTQFLEDTNTNLLEPEEAPPHNQPKVFFFARADLWYEEAQDPAEKCRAEWKLIPRDELPPRLQLEKDRTLLAILFQLSRTYQLAISLDKWHHFDCGHWAEVTSAAHLRAPLRESYLNHLNTELSSEHHWNSFKTEEVMSLKSNQWICQLPSTGNSCLPSNIMTTSYQIVLGTLPVKCNKYRNRKEGDTTCVM